MSQQNKTRSLYFPKRITEALKGIFDYPLTIVEAPMGYGKTTAVREYLADTHAKILWQKVFDSSIDGFWKGLCRLFSEVNADCSHDLAQLGFPNDSASLQEAVTLIEGIRLPEKTVFVIDDYHLLNGEEVGGFIQFLAENEINNLHIVLTARFIEALNIEELLLKGYLYHITKETFELLPTDIIKYYKLCGISIKETEADMLYSTTEGWISALYLMMLNYKDEGSFMIIDNIYKLIDNAIFKPSSDDIKDFLLTICIFSDFTKKQAIHMWGNDDAEILLDTISRKIAFVNHDAAANSYQIHNIFTNFLQELFEKKDLDFKKDLYQKAGHWYLGTGDYLAAMHYYYTAGDFDNLLQAVELDKAGSFINEHKELVIKYFEECPEESKQKHLVALLIYAMSLMTFNERERFAQTCEEFVRLLQSSSLDPDIINRLMGEFELLLSFTSYNDIVKMSEHHKKALDFLKSPSAFTNTTGSWTFGSPSVLYMFYRESGKLEQAVQQIKEAMPYYYQLTSGHGTGAEYVMEAEWHFNKGDFENAEITGHKALSSRGAAHQPNLVMCALFLMVRLALIKGDYAHAHDLFNKIHEEMEQNKVYMLIHLIDMCAGFANAYWKMDGKIPEWLSEGDFNSNRLLFPGRAFSNIIYGRVLLVRGEYLKLLGISGQFLGIASVFPNLLANVYTMIYIAAANERIHRKDEASDAMKTALDMAMQDKVYMPFVENCDFIKPLLERLSAQGIYREDIARILELYKPYREAAEYIKKECVAEIKPKLTDREAEIAQLAAEGFSNKIIGVRLFISENTVKTQLKSVFSKLGINSRFLLKQYMNNN